MNNFIRVTPTTLNSTMKSMLLNFESEDKNRSLLFACNFLIMVAILLMVFQRAEAKITPLNLVYNKQKWELDINKYSEAVSAEKNTVLYLKNTGIVLPLIVEQADTAFPSNANFEIITTPKIKINPQKIEEYLNDNIAKKIEIPTSDIKIYTEKHPMKFDGIIMEGKGQNGLKINKNKLLASIDLALNGNIKRIAIPVLEEEARVDIAPDLQNIGIKSLIATGHSTFVNSPRGRIHNIRKGISRYNGLLVKPGEIFSFNEHLGPVDKAHDFTEELVIKPEGTVPEYGGGLCQVSSTLFRAILYGGFPIIERAPHSYAVSYYAQVGGHGLDATVYPGARDLKFLNDSPAYLLIQAYAEGDHAWFKFYGTDDGRKVRLEGPYVSNQQTPGPTEIVETDKLAPGGKKQVEKPHNGFDVTWWRYLEKNNVIQKEITFSHYKAVPAKILVGRM